MGRGYITVVWLVALLSLLSACPDPLLFEPDPLHHELVRTYARETGWADQAFTPELTCIAVSEPICRCSALHLDRIIAGLDRDSRLDLNRASRSELMRLPGIGPTIADRIIAHRASAPFQAIEDIMQVEGIGPGRFNRLVPVIRVTAVSPEIVPSFALDGSER